MRCGVNKKVVLGLLVLLALVMGALDASQLRGGQQEAMLLSIHAMLSVVLVFLWFRQDAWERLYRTSWALKAGMVLLPVLALPWYFFRSRGTAGGAWSLAWLTLAFVVVMLFYRLGTGLGG